MIGHIYACTYALLSLREYRLMEGMCFCISVAILCWMVLGWAVNIPMALSTVRDSAGFLLTVDWCYSWLPEGVGGEWVPLLLLALAPIVARSLDMGDSTLAHSPKWVGPWDGEKKESRHRLQRDGLSEVCLHLRTNEPYSVGNAA